MTPTNEVEIADAAILSESLQIVWSNLPRCDQGVDQPIDHAARLNGLDPVGRRAATGDPPGTR